jgi:hypothetical protein
LEVADVEKERLVDEVEEKEIRNTELLIGTQTPSQTETARQPDRQERASERGSQQYR